VYSGGLSRGYMRTFMPAARYAFDAFSPFTCRSVIAEALAMPFDAMLDGNPGRLATLKQDVVRAGMRAVLGVEMPIAPKRRFQDGAHASPRGRLTKAWCRRVFDELWEDRLREADADDRRSGNETSIAAGAR
jgi:asparagine synthase (glutamine-hydrolysing)